VTSYSRVDACCRRRRSRQRSPRPRTRRSPGWGGVAATAAGMTPPSFRCTRARVGTWSTETWRCSSSSGMHIRTLDSEQGVGPASEVTKIPPVRAGANSARQWSTLKKQKKTLPVIQNFQMLSIEILNRRKPEKIKKGINPQFDMIFLGGLLHIFMAKDLLGLLPRYHKPRYRSRFWIR
jgi:hypothetical protein